METKTWKTYEVCYCCFQVDYILFKTKQNNILPAFTGVKHPRLQKRESHIRWLNLMSSASGDHFCFVVTESMILADHEAKE